MFKKYSQMKLQIWSVAKFGTVKVSRIRPFCGRVPLNLRLGINDLAAAVGGENAAKLLNLTVPRRGSRHGREHFLSLGSRRRDAVNRCNPGFTLPCRDGDSRPDRVWRAVATSAIVGNRLRDRGSRVDRRWVMCCTQNRFKTPFCMLWCDSCCLKIGLRIGI